MKILCVLEYLLVCHHACQDKKNRTFCRCQELNPLKYHFFFFYNFIHDMKCFGQIPSFQNSPYPLSLFPTNFIFIFQNALCPFSDTSMCTSIGHPIVAWTTYQGLHSSRKLTLLPLAFIDYPIIISSSARNGISLAPHQINFQKVCFRFL